MEYGWNFAQHCSIPVLLSAAATVFSCVASRNKRGPSSTAPGYRSDANGTLHFVCSYGYVWSSKTNNIRSHNLHFSAPWLNPSYAYYRANGYQLRCLSE